MKRFYQLLVIVLSSFCISAYAQNVSPFIVEPSVISTNGTNSLDIMFVMSQGTFLYADKIVVRIDGVPVSPLSPFMTEKHDDVFTGQEVDAVKADQSVAYPVKPYEGMDISLEISYQGCSETFCYLPETKHFVISWDNKIVPVEGKIDVPVKPSVSSDWKVYAEKFKVAGTAGGYLNADDFLAFLKDSKDNRQARSGMLSKLRSGNIIWALIAVLIGGLALNLTPCVLPMIPVNVAIIGAGAESGNKLRGGMLGAVYGAGIALTYGVLGVIVTTTSSRLGILNSHPVFNFIVAVIFLSMALAMFGVFNLDLSRWQGNIRTGEKQRGKLPVVFFLGALSALLAGACVAPVVMSVLIYAADLYQQKNLFGLMLPFLLGIGMALPWPFLGAGFSALPRPGAWMEKVKIVFAVIILLAGLYYVKLGYDQVIERVDAGKAKTIANADKDLALKLRQALDADKPVLIDFWASWCKNCVKMEQTTFKDKKIIEAKNSFVVIKYQAENPADQKTREVLDYYKAVGMPTYIVLTPEKKDR